MFNIEKEKEIALELYERRLAIIEKCKGIEKHIDYFSPYSNDIYIHDYTYNEYVKALREISAILKVEYRLFRYYCSSCGGILINYIFGDFEIIFKCTETEKALEKLGKGKCRIVENTVKEKKIVCDA